MTEHLDTAKPAHSPTQGGSAELLSGFAEAVPVPVLLMTPDLRIRHANTAFVQALDIGTEHYLHKKLPSHWLMAPREDIPRLRERFQKIVQATEDLQPIHVSLRSSDGTEIPTTLHARLLPGLEKGPSDFVVATFAKTDQGNDGAPEISTSQDGGAAQISRSEERLRLIFEYAPDAYYLCDLKGNFVDGNRAAEKMVGYPKAELVGKSFLKLNLLPKSQIPRAARSLVRNAVGKPTGPDEFVLNRKDGSQVDVEIRTYPVRMQGQILVLGIARDITERQQAQRKLQDSEAKYRDLHESSRDGCVATDLTGRILESNTAFREMLGYSVEELSRLTYEDITPSQWRAEEKRIVENQVFARGYSDLYEKEYTRKDGTTFPIELRVYLKKDAQGEPTGMWAIVRNISRRRRAEERLRQSEERFRVMTDSAQDAIMMMDPQGRVTFFNKTAETIFGWTAAEAIGKNMHALLAPERFHDAYHKGLKHFQRTGRGAAIGKTLELTALRKDGTEFPIEISLAAVKLDDAWHAIGVIRDITERKKAEEKLASLNEELQVAVRELERSNQELSDFAHITAHDLKAPLRGIATLADWLSADCGEQLDEQGQENLRLLRQRVDRMVGLINGILTYSKIGRSSRSVEALDTGALVREVIEQVAPPEHVAVRVEGDFPTITAEKTRLTQVFQNLISNAIKYSDKAQGLVRVTAGARGDAWEFCVADNGPGIEARHFDRIFQMFQTLSPADQTESTGLGLAMVKKIVELYDGRVWLESQIGEGSAFYFALPKARDGAATDRP